MFFMQSDLLKNINELIKTGAIKLILDEKEYKILVLYLNLINQGYTDDRKLFSKLGTICKEEGIFESKLQCGTFYHIFNRMTMLFNSIINEYTIDGLNQLYATNMFEDTLEKYSKYFIIKVIIENNLEFECTFKEEINRIKKQIELCGPELPFMVISKLELPTKLENILIRNNIYTIADITQKNNCYDDFSYVRNFGEKTFEELVNQIHDNGYFFANEQNNKLKK